VPVRVDLESSEPLPAPVLCPPKLDLRRGGRRVRLLAPAHGQWSAELADQVMETLLRAWRADAHHQAWRWLPVRSGSLASGWDGGPSVPPATDAVGGVTVLIGPGRRAGDARHREALEAAGAEVQLLRDPGADHWPAIADALRATTSAIVAIPLPGVALHPDWLATARAVTAGSRVAGVTGVGLGKGDSAGALQLRSRHMVRGPFVPADHAPQCVLLATSAYRAVGGLDAQTFALGVQAPLLDLLERVLDAGLVVGHIAAPGLSPAGAYRPARSRCEWQRSQARGALFALHAGRRGWRGVPWFVTRGIVPFVEQTRQMLERHDPGARSLVGTGTAFATGCGRALVVGVSRASRGTARPRGSSAGRSGP
nr:hypothetical protein [Solirubrobacterales bacterium]